LGKIVQTPVSGNLRDVFGVAFDRHPRGVADETTMPMMTMPEVPLCNRRTCDRRHDDASTTTMLHIFDRRRIRTPDLDVSSDDAVVRHQRILLLAIPSISDSWMCSLGIRLLVVVVVMIRDETLLLL
jgi:hypothetical protein